jgi:arginine N-succinyltransferase
MSFQEADEFNAVNGNQFIADLMPKTPIYTAMLTDSARAVIGLPHPNGRAAMRMLETEGFDNAGYVDIFDGGPTMVGQIDQLKTIAAARDITLSATHEKGGDRMLIATGTLADYRCTWGFVQEGADGTVSLDAASAARLKIEIGDGFTMAGRA